MKGYYGEQLTNRGGGKKCMGTKKAARTEQLDFISGIR